jgi:hypothetical protein
MLWKTAWDEWNLAVFAASDEECDDKDEDGA